MQQIIVILTVLSFSLPLSISAQSQKPNYVGEWYKNSARGKKPQKADPFSNKPSNFAQEKRYNLKANANQLNSILNTKPAFLNLTIPYGDETYTLNLARVEVTAEEFNVKTNQGSVKHDVGVQYRGIVNNNPGHIASLSLTKTDKSAFFSTDAGNFVLTNDGVDFMVYNEQVMNLPGIIYCHTPSSSTPITVETYPIAGVGCKTVKVYLECDYAFFQNKGSNVTTLTNFVIGFFNQVATIYANENVSMQVSEIFAWNTPDPYVNITSNSDIMNAFKANRGTSFNGNIAHFLSTRTPMGGIAYVDALCNKAYAYGVSRIASTYNNFPTYSWTVNVVAHELGHTVASPHTHSCTWVGGPLDNCHAPDGTCTAGPAPVNGGTIMSYCHMTSSGINFNNGFGTQPGNLLRTRVQNASCIPAGTSAAAPAALSTSNITGTSATLNWAAVAGASMYTAQYKLSSASTWIPVNATTATYVNITGLTAGSNYVWQVKADCSAFSASSSFTTTASGSTTCSAPTQLGSNNITISGVQLAWAAVTGATSYTVQYRPSSSSTWNTINATTNTVSFAGLTAGTTYIWQVKANCSGYSAQATFVTQSSTSSGCSAPAGLSSSNVSQTGATLNWGAVSGATGYTVQYKPSAASIWTSANVSATSVSVSGLTSGTTYNWQVKANCSVYSTQTSFTTTTTSVTGCTAPANLTNTNITGTTATLSWTGPANATSYQVRYKLVGASGWTIRNVSASSLNISGLMRNRNYQWMVNAKCGSTSSAFSLTKTFTTAAL